MSDFGYKIAPMHRLSTALFLAALACTTVVVAAGRAGAAELVMFEASGCEWCRTWHEAIGPIYPLTREGRAAPLRRADIAAPRPADLEAIGPIRFTPTFVVIENGREIGRITGYPGEDFFWGLLGEIVEELTVVQPSGS